MKKLLLFIGLGAVVVIGLAFAGWWFFLKSDPEPRAAIVETPVQESETADATGPSGTFSVAPGDTNNFVGYRVTEKLVASVVESTATGRTNNVTASLTIDGTTVSDVTVEADLRDLKSDNGFRDGRLHSSGLESDQFPQAKFVLAEPITLPSVPGVGETITTEGTGDFTLHGVTKRVTIPLEGRWDGTDVQVVGHLPIVMGDYNITPPTAPAVASVDDHGEMEFQLFFKKG